LTIYKEYGIDEKEQKQAVGEPVAGGIVAGNGGQAAGAATGNPPRVAKKDSAVVWKLHADNTLEPVKVSLGITDHAYTEVNAVLKGALKEGDDVVIRSVVAKSQGLGGLRR
jgi:hypothetical protein